MFNSRYKKEALKEREEAGNKYKGEYEDAIKKSTELHEDKESGVEILKKVDEYKRAIARVFGLGKSSKEKPGPLLELSRNLYDTLSSILKDATNIDFTPSEDDE